MKKKIIILLTTTFIVLSFGLTTFADTPVSNYRSYFTEEQLTSFEEEVKPLLDENYVVLGYLLNQSPDAYIIAFDKTTAQYATSNGTTFVRRYTKSYWVSGSGVITQSAFAPHDYYFDGTYPSMYCTLYSFSDYDVYMNGDYGVKLVHINSTDLSVTLGINGTDSAPPTYPFDIMFEFVKLLVSITYFQYLLICLSVIAIIGLTKKLMYF